MVKMRYLGPDAMFRQRLRNHWRDCAEQMLKVRPLGPEYCAMDEACRATSALYEQLYGENIMPPVGGGVAGNGARGNSPP